MRSLLTGLVCALMTASCMPLLEGEPAPGPGQQVRLTVLHTSDIHSRLIPYDFTPLVTDVNLGLIPDASPFGGATRMAALVKRERRNAERVMHLDSGDCFQGAPVFNLNLGEVEFRFLSDIRLDAAVIGNHEFDGGLANFVRQARNWATFPLLAANYQWEDPREPGNAGAALVSAPYMIRNYQGLKVAVIGMANISSLNSIVEGGNSLQTTPLEQNEVARAYVDLLRPVVDLVFLVSHLGLHEDQDVVNGYEAFYEYQRARPFLERQENPWQLLEWTDPSKQGQPNAVVRVRIPGVVGIDAIFGGHLHVVLSPPQTLVDPSGRKVLLVHSGAFAKYVGRLDAVVRMPDASRPLDGAEIVSHDYRAFPLDALWCDDAMRRYYQGNFWDPGQFLEAPGVREAIERCQQLEDRPTTAMLQPYILGMDYGFQLTSIFSYAPQDIARRNNSTGGDSPLGNIAADAMRKRRRVEAEVALTNSLGIRDNLYAGAVTQEAMFNVFPFENTINIMYLSGAEMQEMFDFVAERSAERGCTSQAQVSGVRFTMDCSQAQINNLRIPCDPARGTADCPQQDRQGHAPWQCIETQEGNRCWAHPATDIVINGRPLDTNANYRIAVNDYIAKGGSGFNVLKRNTTRIETGISLRDSLIGYMKDFCTCDDINAGRETRGGRPDGQRCGNLINGRWVVDERIRSFCREAQLFKNELAPQVGSCTCGQLLQNGYNLSRCNAPEGVSTAEQAQAYCNRQKKMGDCTCEQLESRPFDPQGCGLPADTTPQAVQSYCRSLHPGPYTGSCTCREALSGSRSCGSVTLQLRNFCENPTSMAIAFGVEDGRITRRVR